MSWKKITERGITIWECSHYSDLQYNEILNLAQHGQPKSPSQAGFDQFFNPDFKNIIVRMPQAQVMNEGYGKSIKPEHFPFAKKFLDSQYDLPNGKYTFSNLLKLGIVKKQDRFTYTNLYKGMASTPLHPSSNDITSPDAAFIHGTVGFALMASTLFEVYEHSYVIRAEIGAIDDNWNYQSTTDIAKKLNPIVAAVFGDAKNLQPNKAKGEKHGQIDIQFRGGGKITCTSLRKRPITPKNNKRSRRINYLLKI